MRIGGRPHSALPVQIWRAFLTLVGLAIAAISLSVPAAASRSHLASHAASPVLTHEHHHHDDQGEVDVHPADDEGSSKTVTDKAGHSHASTSVADIAIDSALYGAPDYADESSATFPADTPALNTLGWAPQIRPPKTA